MASLEQYLNNKIYNILIVGDGDFSFTLSFCNKLKFSNSKQFPLLLYLKNYYGDIQELNVNIISTSYDNKLELIQKYPNSVSTLKKINLLNNISNKQSKKEKKLKSELKDVLINLKIMIKHKIDATQISHLSSSISSTSFDLIIFNHPHLGFEDLKRNSSLLMHVLFEFNKLINNDGMIWISLIEGQFNNWNVNQKMKKNKLCKQLKLLSSFLFYDKYYFGYTTRRHQSNKTFRNNLKSINYIFIKSNFEKYHPFQKYIQLINESINKCLKFNQINHNQNDKQFKCNKCNKKFIQQRSLKTHQKFCLLRMNENNDKQKNNNLYKCNQCNKEFKYLIDIQQHNIAKHNKLNKNMEINDIENEEEKKNESQIIMNIKCVLCDRSFENEIHHKQWITPGNFNVMNKCNKCYKQFLFKRDLEQHYNTCITK